MAKNNVRSTEDRSDIRIVSEEGVMALAFACLGQDAGVPGKPYIRIFPTSVDQCFAAIHGTPLTCDDPALVAMRTGNDDISMMFDDTANEEANDVASNANVSDEEKERRKTIGVLARPKANQKIRNFLSTLLPIDVVDGIYNTMATDQRQIRRAEMEARAFAARLATTPKTTKVVVANDGDQCDLFQKVQTA